MGCWPSSSSELRADREFCESLEGDVDAFLALTLLSFVFWRASFNRFDRLELLFNALGGWEPWIKRI